ncbi:hypothetical protein ACFLIN_09985 [Corynebacterium kutscheri]|uniref:Hypothetical membrane protein n=1 Tax=Corynebacterium kutscheri TaxID=35755 RepID=A0A0F6R148_9CORY|nr:hypothetical protein [Corynebacterium kutscheri]AKE42107.1 hypothetical protein UL82_09850 [Corynebacterium kutscheri]VEH05967.1 hypothetical membrane protein [Corynebacterium kutscheri]VEH10450.1 hypothetical membrane protein [Corynebacterium kutscheri]
MESLPSNHDEHESRNKLAAPSETTSDASDTSSETPSNNDSWETTDADFTTLDRDNAVADATRTQKTDNEELPQLPSFVQNPTKRDVGLYIAFTALTIYGFAIMPFRAALIVNQPVLYSFLTGSSLTMTAHGANNPTNYGFLAAMALVSTISGMKFLPVFYLAGKWWGEEFITLSFGKRQPLWWRKTQNFIRQHTGLSLFISYIPFVPIPPTIVIIIAAIKQVRWQVVTAYTFVYILILKIFYAWLGATFDQTVIDGLQVVDRYLLWITLALLGWTMFVANRKPSLKKS